MDRWSGPARVLRAAALMCLALAVCLWGGPRPLDLASSGPLSLEEDERPNTPEKLVALTFDDGPRRSTTSALLDGLEERGAKATFFLIGAQVEANQDLVLRMAQGGHQVGIHTFDHVTVTGLSRQDYDQQVERTRRLLVSILGEMEFWLRPPYGLLDENALAWADCPVVLWSVDPEDWKDDQVGRVVDHVLTHVSDGDIILMHDFFPSSVEAALIIVDALQQEGYRFVTVQELLEARGISPETGVAYRQAPPVS